MSGLTKSLRTAPSIWPGSATGAWAPLPGSGTRRAGSDRSSRSSRPSCRQDPLAGAVERDRGRAGADRREPARDEVVGTDLGARRDVDPVAAGRRRGRVGLAWLDGGIHHRDAEVGRRGDLVSPRVAIPAAMAYLPGAGGSIRRCRARCRSAGPGGTPRSGRGRPRRSASGTARRAEHPARARDDDHDEDQTSSPSTRPRLVIQLARAIRPDQALAGFRRNHRSVRTRGGRSSSGWRRSP